MYREGTMPENPNSNQSDNSDQQDKPSTGGSENAASIQSKLDLFRNEPAAPIEKTDAELIIELGDEGFQAHQMEQVRLNLLAAGNDLINPHTGKWRHEERRQTNKKDGKSPTG